MRAELELFLACAGIECGRLGSCKLEGRIWTTTFYSQELVLTILGQKGHVHQYICMSAQGAFELILEHYHG